MHSDAGATKARRRLKLANSTSVCETCPVRQKSFCSGIPYFKLNQLAASKSAYAISSGQSIYREGEPDGFVDVITRGTANLFRLMPDGRRQVLDFLFAGDFTDLAFSTIYASSVQAITDVTLCRFPGPKLRKLTNAFPDIRRQLLQAMSARLVHAQDHIVLLGRKTAHEKIASFLLMLLSQNKQPNSEEIIRLPMTRTDIGDYTGLAEETVSRILTQFRKLNYIAMPTPSEIHITDAKQLNTIVNGPS